MFEWLLIKSGCHHNLQPSLDNHPPDSSLNDITNVIQPVNNNSTTPSTTITTTTRAQQSILQHLQCQQATLQLPIPPTTTQWLLQFPAKSGSSICHPNHSTQHSFHSYQGAPALQLHLNIPQGSLYNSYRGCMHKTPPRGGRGTQG